MKKKMDGARIHDQHLTGKGDERNIAPRFGQPFAEKPGQKWMPEASVIMANSKEDKKDNYIELNNAVPNNNVQINVEGNQEKPNESIHKTPENRGEINNLLNRSNEKNEEKHEDDSKGSDLLNAFKQGVAEDVLRAGSDDDPLGI